MTGGGSDAGGGRPPEEAVHRVARAVGVEDGPAVVALLADPEAPEASWDQASRICDAVAARRRIVVANLAGPGSGFDAYLGAGEAQGVEGVRTGQLKLSEAPVQVGGRRFLYVPAGPPSDGDAGAEVPPPLADPKVAGAVETLATKIREAGGALLVYVTPDALPDRRATDLLDAAVRLAGAVGVAGVTTLGRLDPGASGPDESVETFLGLPDEPEDAAGDAPAPSAGEAEAGEPAAGGTEPAAPSPGAGPAERDAAESGKPEAAAEPDAAGPARAGDASAGTWTYADEEPAAGEAPADAAAEEAAAAGAEGPAAGTRRPASGGDEAGAGPPPAAVDEEGGERASGWRRHRRAARAPLGKIALGAALVAALAGGWWYLTQRSVPETAAAGGPAPGAAREGPPADGGAGDAGQARGADPALAGVEAAPELPLSVLVASYASWPAARERIDRWSAEEGSPLLLAAPTPVRDRLYWRVFAGALADREAALALNRELVRRGWKEEATSWEVRPASLAFRLSVAPSRSAAADRVSDLRSREIPAYALPAAAGADTVWGIWAGAFESRDAAATLGRSLRDEGVRAELTTRRGIAGGP